MSEGSYLGTVAFEVLDVQQRATRSPDTRARGPAGARGPARVGPTGTRVAGRAGPERTSSARQAP